MAEEKYPIGIQTFEKLIERGFSYVDKTRFIAKLVKNDGYYFLSRPRRFGKSLLLSTLQAYFEGRRELFKGLYLETADVDWTPTPVIHIDLNNGLYAQDNGLEEHLGIILSMYENRYGIHTPAGLNPASRFGILIRGIWENTGRKVVILVDEYDKPLLDLEDNIELYDKNQAILKGFFSNLKSLDACLKFVFLTGVARFNKVSIFSDLNNLNDISISRAYAEICGWTESELKDNFKEGIKKLAETRKETIEETLTALRRFYDGYQFSESSSKLYNPFSVLKALFELSISPYWFATGTPTFLAKRVKANGIVLPDLDDQYCSKEDLLEVGAGTGSPIGLMFQTGYLSIDRYDEDLGLYKLRFPNREVELGFAKQLLPLYIPDSNISSKPFSIMNFKIDLNNGNPEGFMVRLESLFKSMAYESQNEDNYRSIVWLLCTLSGTETIVEHHSYRGRSDLEVKTRNYIYVFEFKHNENVEAAMAQLHNRDYAGQYRTDPRTIFLIGANFSSDKLTRCLTGWQIEKLQYK